jgi:formate dehydrogenase iron-sulfur subunit
VQQVLHSGLRGRGGAAFPAGIKWKTVLGAAPQKYIVCNADEGDSGTFSDRMTMEGDPFMLIEGMAIAGSRWAPPRATSTSAPNTRTRSPP